MRNKRTNILVTSVLVVLLFGCMFWYVGFEPRVVGVEAVRVPGGESPWGGRAEGVTAFTESDHYDVLVKYNDLFRAKGMRGVAILELSEPERNELRVALRRAHDALRTDYFGDHHDRVEILLEEAFDAINGLRAERLPGVFLENRNASRRGQALLLEMLTWQTLRAIDSRAESES